MYVNLYKNIKKWSKHHNKKTFLNPQLRSIRAATNTEVLTDEIVKKPTTAMYVPILHIEWKFCHCGDSNRWLLHYVSTLLTVRLSGHKITTARLFTKIIKNHNDIIENLKKTNQRVCFPNNKCFVYTCGKKLNLKGPWISKPFQSTHTEFRLWFDWKVDKKKRVTCFYNI